MRANTLRWNCVGALCDPDALAGPAILRNNPLSVVGIRHDAPGRPRHVVGLVESSGPTCAIVATPRTNDVFAATFSNTTFSVTSAQGRVGCVTIGTPYPAGSRAGVREDILTQRASELTLGVPTSFPPALDHASRSQPLEFPFRDRSGNGNPFLDPGPRPQGRARTRPGASPFRFA